VTKKPPGTSLELVKAHSRRLQMSVFIFFKCGDFTVSGRIGSARVPQSQRFREVGCCYLLSVTELLG
jgi:hypothetical protein